MQYVKPEVGRWYKCRGREQMFEVVSIDDDDGMVELQDHDGNLDEVEVRAWFALDIEPVEAPEDWAAPMDNIEPDDIASNESDASVEANMKTQPTEAWQDAAPDEDDEWAERSSDEPYIEDEPSAQKRLQ